jgi:hypothetical protein
VPPWVIENIFFIIGAQWSGGGNFFGFFSDLFNPRIGVGCGGRSFTALEHAKVRDFKHLQFILANLSMTSGFKKLFLFQARS